jgi:hypothetical protein
MIRRFLGPSIALFWVSFLAGAALANEKIALMEKVEACLAQGTDPETCFTPAAQCETAEFLEAYGPIEGAGRGWCEGSMEEFWSIMVSRASSRYFRCLQSHQDHEDAAWYLLRSERSAGDNFRESRCLLVGYLDRRGAGGGQSAQSACLVAFDQERVIDFHKRAVACTEEVP